MLVWISVAWADPQVELRARTAELGCRDVSCICEALCAGRWATDGATATIRWPLGPSGSTKRGLVPLGPSLSLELAADGRALGCGMEPAPACPEAGPAIVGFWSDRPGTSPATMDQRGRWLWLRADGSWVGSEPGWTVSGGRWRIRPDAVVLEASWRVAGTGGGMLDDLILGSSCAPEAPEPVRTLPVASGPAGWAPLGWRRAPAESLDEGFYRAGCR